MKTTHFANELFRKFCETSKERKVLMPFNKREAYYNKDFIAIFAPLLLLAVVTQKRQFPQLRLVFHFSQKERKSFSK